MAKQAKSGDLALREEAGVLERLAVHLDAGGTVAGFAEPIPSDLEAPDGQAAARGRERPGRNRPGLESELAELGEDAAAFREGASALEEIVRRLFAALDLIGFFTAGERETRAWTLRRGGTALDAAAAVHTDLASGFVRAEVIRWDDLVECGSHAEARPAGPPAPRGQGLRRRGRRRSQHQVQPPR